MLDNMNAVQARIQQIRDRISSITNPPQTDTQAQPAETFQNQLQTAQAAEQGASPAPLMTGHVGPMPAATGAVLESGHVTVPAASLGELPPMPVRVGGTAGQAGPSDLQSIVSAAAAEHGVPESLVHAVIQTESGGNPRAVSRAGALGLMQLMPENVSSAGITDPFDPEQNVRAGVQQLAGLMKKYHGDLDLVLAGYNAGPGAVRKYGGVPPFAETQNYIRKVRSAMDKLGEK